MTRSAVSMALKRCRPRKFSNDISNRQNRRRITDSVELELRKYEHMLGTNDDELISLHAHLEEVAEEQPCS